ncbi:MAG: type II toxin-antitoxin system Phd/YefM family antitoxin [Chloroflexi bacterium]|nr:type II toxin-antitoxin system Phd/YefM family antitoxin [Chloroflexota bacterium]
MIWQLQDAKSKFSQVVNQALEQGPQIVTRHGEEVVVVLSMAEYRQMMKPKTTLLDLLLASPLAGSGVEITRDRKDVGREVVL